MNDEDLKILLEKFRILNSENECIEFKEAKSNYDFRKLGKYFSALANEANLKGLDSAWLVFGIKDKPIPRTIVGTNYRSNRAKLDSLKLEIADKTTNRITFTEIYELNHEDGRIILFQIPPAPKGLPVAFDGHYYGRDGESLGALNMVEIESIRGQATNEDWSAKIIPDASIEDLDYDALLVAKEKFKEKSSREKYYDEIDEWDAPTFLDKAKITINGKITNTAILLLGKEEAVHYISPSISEITWKLEAEERAYEHFGCPLLLSTTKVLKKIRNIKFKFFPDNELLATTVDKYDTRTILEAMHNCIAHQDYLLGSRIIVTEQIDKLIFSNAGSFFEGNPDDYFTGTKTPKKYRNTWLVKAMVNLGMIDTMGYGIHTMYLSQRKRFFPLPDYEPNLSQKVVLNIYGHTIDVNYSKLLIENKDLSLSKVVLLDRVQKKLPITKEGAALLRKDNLIEGRRPNYILSFEMAAHSGTKTDYIKQRGFKDKYYKDLILNFIDKNTFASKKDINKLLMDTLPSILSEKQKENKVRNIVYAMSKRDNSIYNKGTNRHPKWMRTN